MVSLEIPGLLPVADSFLLGQPNAVVPLASVDRQPQIMESGERTLRLVGGEFEPDLFCQTLKLRLGKGGGCGQLLSVNLGVCAVSYGLTKVIDVN